MTQASGTNSQLQQDIQALQHIVQYGVGRNRRDAAFDMMLAKLSGSLPPGADAPNFATRKKIISLNLLLNLLKLLFAFVFFAGLGVMFIWVASDDLIANFIIVAIGLAFLAVGGWLGKKLRYAIVLFNAIYQLQQQQPDPAPPFIPVVDEYAISQQFARQRKMSRMVGAAMALLCGALLLYFLQKPPANTTSLTFVLPVFMMLGVGLIFSPVSRAENVYRYGTAQLSWGNMPGVIKLCCGIGVLMAAALLGWYEGWV